jgi:hypothetical protein
VVGLWVTFNEPSVLISNKDDVYKIEARINAPSFITIDKQDVEKIDFALETLIENKDFEILIRVTEEEILEVK